MNTRITREKCVSLSVRDYLIAWLILNEYPLGEDPGEITVMDSYPDEDFESDINRSFVTIGIEDDDGGLRIEMGSTLTERTYIFEFNVLSNKGYSSESLAHTVRSCLETAERIPFFDYRKTDPNTGDVLIFGEIAVDSNEIDDPKPWEMNRWTATVPVIDTFYLPG